MSTPQASEPTPDPGHGAIAFTAAGERALDDLADRVAASCDGTIESITSLLEQVLTTDLADLAAALDVVDFEPQSPGRNELLDGVDVEETTPGQSAGETASRRRRAHEVDNLPGTSTMPPGTTGPGR